MSSNSSSLHKFDASKAEDMRFDSLIERSGIADFHFEGSDSGDGFGFENIE